jgi:septum formation protein
MRRYKNKAKLPEMSDYPAPSSNASHPQPAAIILGSSSRYRKSLMERLYVPFTVDVPDIDESPEVGETPLALSKRLALQKAQAVAGRYTNGWVIGSDQVAVCGQTLYGKPGTHEKAVAMLGELSGQCLSFHTALCLYDAASHQYQLDVVSIEAKFRTLTSQEIEHYLRIEQPYDCAASARSEGLGITLLEYMRGDDDTALIGLPLIRLCAMFRAWGLALPMASSTKSEASSTASSTASGATSIVTTGNKTI